MFYQHPYLYLYGEAGLIIWNQRPQSFVLCCPRRIEKSPVSFDTGGLFLFSAYQSVSLDGTLLGDLDLDLRDQLLSHSDLHQSGSLLRSGGLFQLSGQVGQLLGVGSIVVHHILHQRHQLFHRGMLAAARAATAIATAAVVVVMVVASLVEMVMGVRMLVVVGVCVGMLMGMGNTVVGVLVGMGVIMFMVVAAAGDVIVMNMHKSSPFDDE